MSRAKVHTCAKAIADSGLKIAFVESATAGRMCSEFSLVPESGKILQGGISCYEVFIKENIIKVPHYLIETFTPESAEVTAALAQNARLIFKCDIIVAVTGLTTKGGSESPEKPVGTMFIYILHPTGFISHREIFTGNQESIVLQTIDRASELITRLLDTNKSTAA
ncbi:CinA family protein [Flavobacterium sp. NRK1]|uniref:CinA family protein n=1 Tax=Flavobacterium sp. NRK1 TaxID=2954929 RepID=UPI002091FFA0|nr:CinA family protein [Flavobacterium sp. NRK1]MCO6149652.1 CinA family protein [Flavobacterium sp. NRK1]